MIKLITTTTTKRNQWGKMNKQTKTASSGTIEIQS
jgi:hypothetical protein